MRRSFLSLLAAPVGLFADCALAEVSSPATAPMMTAGYNAPCHIDIQKQRTQIFSISGSFIYWQATQDNMELGVEGDSSDSLNTMDGKFINLNTDFKPGFKIAGAVNFMPDNWDLFLEYTRFHGTNHTSKKLESTSATHAIYPTWQFPSTSQPHYYAAKESWKLNMDFVDAELGRSYYVGKKLTYRPYVGLRAPWILQKLTANYQQEASDPDKNVIVKQTVHSWGIGPRAGIALDWHLGHSFKLYGAGGADVVFTQYTKNKFNQEATVGGVVPIHGRFKFSQSHLNVLRAHTDLTLGMGWDRYFASDKCHLNLTADYGFQVFFNQNMFRNFVNDQALAKSILPNGSLYVQGLTVTLNFDY